MTLKATLIWRSIKTQDYKSWRASNSHGRYEVRSYKARNWQCYLNGRKLGQIAFTSHIAAIDAIERIYYIDASQMKENVRIGRKNGKS